MTSRGFSARRFIGSFLLILGLIPASARAEEVMACPRTGGICQCKTKPVDPEAQRRFDEMLQTVASSGITIHFIDLFDFFYDRVEITIKPGDFVTWTNREGSHTVTSRDSDNFGLPLFDSGLLDVPEGFARQFLEEGDFEYFCIPHELLGMTGVVHVRADEPPPPEPEVIPEPTSLALFGLGALGVLSIYRRRRRRQRSLAG